MICNQQMAKWSIAYSLATVAPVKGSGRGSVKGETYVRSETSRSRIHEENLIGIVV